MSYKSTFKVAIILASALLFYQNCSQNKEPIEALNSSSQLSSVTTTTMGTGTTQPGSTCPQNLYATDSAWFLEVSPGVCHFMTSGWFFLRNGGNAFKILSQSDNGLSGSQLVVYRNNRPDYSSASVSRPDVRSVFPCVNTDLTGFDADAGEVKNGGNLVTIPFRGLAVETLSNTTLLNANLMVPMACRAGVGAPAITSCMDAMGYIDSSRVVQTSGSCQLEISGWAWSNSDQDNADIVLNFLGTSRVFKTQTANADVNSVINGIAPQCIGAGKKVAFKVTYNSLAANGKWPPHFLVNGYVRPSARPSWPLYDYPTSDGSSSRVVTPAACKE